MTAAEIRNLMPIQARPFVKAPGAAPTDAFDDLGVHVLYRGDGRCEAIELGAPSAPTLEGTAVLAVPFTSVELLVKTLDSQLEIDESGLTSYALGLAIYCPGHDENPNLLVEGVFVFERGYYDAR